MVMAVLVLLLAACVHPSVPSSASGSSSSSSTSESTASPSIEPTTGLESPVSPTHGSVALSLAPAPTGRTGNSGDNDQCIQVNWLGNPIPPGDIVTITSVQVEKPFTFDPAVTAQCGGAPSCVNYQFSAANDSGPFCNVGLGYKNGSISLDGPEPPKDGQMELVGHLSCQPDIGSAACQRDAVAIQRPGIGTVTFQLLVIDNTPPPTSPPPESPSSSPPESPPSASATSGSSSPAAPGSS